MKDSCAGEEDEMKRVMDIITYGLLGGAVALCAVGAFYAYPRVVPMVVSILAAVGFLGLLVALLVVRVRFQATYNYWTEKPVKMGFRGKPCWEQEKAERWIEGVVQFWTMVPVPWNDGLPYSRSDVTRALRGVTVWFRRDPWSSFGRMVVGLASHEAVVVKYEKKPWESAFMHELGHVIIGKLEGDWGEASSHQKMKTVGFTNASVKGIVDGLP